MAKQVAISKMVSGSYYKVIVGDKAHEQRMRFIGVVEATYMYGEHKFPVMYLWNENKEGVNIFSLREAMQHDELDKFETPRPNEVKWAHRWVFKREDGTLMYARKWVNFKGEKRFPCLMCYPEDQNGEVHTRNNPENGEQLSIVEG